MRTPQEKQFIGCLIGQCLGDALGCPVEGQVPDECKQHVETVLRRGRTEEVGRRQYRFGQYTDDSQLARELLISMVEREGFDPADFAGRIAELFRSHRDVGAGSATRAAARRLIAGVPWDAAGTLPPAAGNGSAMRAGPVGLMYFDDPERMIAVCHDQSRITHQDPRCSAGAVAIAGSVALALQSEAIVPETFLSALHGWVERYEDRLAVALEKMREWLLLPPDAAAAQISHFDVPGGPADGTTRIIPFVIPSVCWSIYSFLRSPEDYWECICTSIAVGGDVDTTAAMAGAISGAHLGADVLPAGLTEKLNDRGTWVYEELVALAKRAYTQAMSKVSR